VHHPEWRINCQWACAGLRCSLGPSESNRVLRGRLSAPRRLWDGPSSLPTARMASHLPPMRAAAGRPHSERARRPGPGMRFSRSPASAPDWRSLGPRPADMGSRGFFGAVAGEHSFPYGGCARKDNDCIAGYILRGESRMTALVEAVKQGNGPRVEVVPQIASCGS
jgi:hypothetical protein